MSQEAGHTSVGQGVGDGEGVAAADGDWLMVGVLVGDSEGVEVAEGCIRGKSRTKPPPPRPDPPLGHVQESGDTTHPPLLTEAHPAAALSKG